MNKRRSKKSRRSVEAVSTRRRRKEEESRCEERGRRSRCGGGKGKGEKEGEGYLILFMVRVPVLSEHKMVISAASDALSRRVTRTPSTISDLQQSTYTRISKAEEKKTSKGSSKVYFSRALGKPRRE